MVYINESFCKGCALCVDLCPKGVLTKSLGKVIIDNNEKCIECGICENTCPDFAIHVRRGKNE